MKVFLFGIDGAMPEMIFGEWLDELPNLKKLIDSGCYAKLNSTIPPVSVVAWASMTTGRMPADHGVFECLHRDKEVLGKMNLSSSKDVKAKRIWEIVAENNKKAISCFVPLTWPIKPYNGILISGNFTPPIPEAKFSYPPEIKEEINSLLGEPLLMDIKNFRNLSKEEIIKEIKKVTQMHISIIKYLIKNKGWDLFFGVITGSDRMNHIFWKYCDKEHRAYDPTSEFKNSLKEYYIYLDKELGEIIESLDKDTTVIVLSDHGITRMHTRVNLSDWLIKEGYLVLKEGVNLSEPMRFEPEIVDWSKTRVFATGAYDGQIFINLKGRDVGGIVDSKDYDLLVDELKVKLKEIRGDDGSVLNTKIFKKKDCFKGKFEDSAPDIIIYFDNLQYGANTSMIGNPTLWSPQTALGSDDATHSRQGIFIMDNCFGRGNKNLGEIDINDIAPTILKKLGVEVPSDMIGKVLG